MNKNIEILKKDFSFLFHKFNFELRETKSYNYALYAKIYSNSVGIYFIYEFRDYIPQIQFTILESDKFESRVGLYTLKELYKNKDFKLKSFYLDEIILFKKEGNYKNFFKDVKTIEEAIKMSSKLVEKYASDFIVGNEEIYAKMDDWLKIQINKE